MSSAPAGTCEFCGYDLRGITSAECPECGQSKTVSLRFDNHEQYHHARAALEHADLLVSFVNAGIAGEIVYGTAKTAGWLRVSSSAYDRVADVLNKIGVRWVEEQRVFVDRIDPTCPRCGADLTAASADACTGCGIGLQWIEEREALDADAEVVCAWCFRDVKLVDGRCPDCNRAAAETTPTDENDVPSTKAPRVVAENLSIWVCLTIGITIPVLLIMLLVSTAFGFEIGFWGNFIAVPIALIISRAVLSSRQRKPAPDG